MSERETILSLQQKLEQQIVGQQHLVERLVMALLCDGHLLVEGAPGLAKTRAIRCLADHIEADFHRIQFTPDLLPSDITGTDIYRPENGMFEFQPGPVFHNLLLADEINRAPAKVQAALLEAMAERQVSVGSKTYPLPELFLVMATQNPIEQEGTYPLPEAQLDRFLMQVNVDYPDTTAEKAILHLNRQERQAFSAEKSDAQVVRISQAALKQARQEINALHVADNIDEYLVQLIMATRQPERWSPQLAGEIAFGASPRATIALDRCARCIAWLQGRDFVTPDDVQAVFHDCLRHRVILSFEAEANNTGKDEVLDKLLACVTVI